MIAALFRLLDDAIVLGKISPDFIIHAHADFSIFSEGPGKEFRKIMETWPRYSKTWD
jgi:hypothetical protein